jgi:hypothetical protein
MSNKRSKSNRGKFFGKRRAKIIQVPADDVRLLDPSQDRDSAWRFLDVVGFEIIQDEKSRLSA